MKKIKWTISYLIRAIPHFIWKVIEIPIGKLEHRYSTYYYLQYNNNKKKQYQVEANQF